MPDIKKASLLIPLFIVCVGHFLVDMMIGIWPVFKTINNVDLAIAGLIGAVSAFAGEGLQIFAGSLSDQGYRKSVLLFGLFASTASAFLVYTDSTLLFLGLYLITCIGSGAFHPSAASIVSELSAKNKALFISLFSSAGAFGLAFSQLFYTQSYHYFDTHTSVLAIPALCLILFTVIAKLKQPAPNPSSTNNHFSLGVFINFFKQTPLRNLYFTQLCNATLFWGTMFLLPDFLKSRDYAPWITFGGGHLLFILGCACMMIPAGYLADKFSERKVIFCSTLSSLVLFYMLIFSPQASEYALLPLLFLLGASFGTVQPVAISLGTSLAPDRKGLISAFLLGGVWCISEAIGQIGCGVLANHFIEDAPAKALAILGLVLFIGSAFAYHLPEKEEIPQFETLAN